MDVRSEINNFSSNKDKPVLLWLLDRYHMSSQWNFVTKATFERYGKNSFQTNRVWTPTEEGFILYNHFNK